MCRNKRLLLEITLLVLLFLFVQCCETYRYQGEKKKTTLNRKEILNRYRVSKEHLQLLQFYLSKQIILTQSATFSYTYEPHRLNLQKHEADRIIFQRGLPGKYIRDDEKETKFLWWKKNRMSLIIHFEKPPMNLMFAELDDGTFKLETTSKKGKEYVMYNGKKYLCKSGADALLEIDARYVPDSAGRDISVQGAPYTYTVCRFWEIVIALGSLTLIGLYLSRSE
jgi:hypothetical protein